MKTSFTKSIRIRTIPGTETFVSRELSGVLPGKSSREVSIHWKKNCLGENGLFLTWQDHSWAEIFDYARRLTRLRSIQGVGIHLASRQFRTTEPSLDAVLSFLDSQIRNAETRGLFSALGDRTFACRSSRKGNHPFRSPELEGAAGALIGRHLPRWKVDLKHPDVVVHLELTDQRLHADIEPHPKDLSKRLGKVFNPRISLRPTAAYIMVRRALDCFDHPALPQPPILLDCFAGSGTILMEAHTLLPDASLLGIEKNGNVFPGLVQNCQGTSGTDLRFGDCFDLAPTMPPESVDLVITNPPLGVRLNRLQGTTAFHRRLFALGSHLLKDGGILGFLSLIRPDAMAGLLTQSHQHPSCFTQVGRMTMILNTLEVHFYLLRKGIQE